MQSASIHSGATPPVTARPAEAASPDISAFETAALRHAKRKETLNRSVLLAQSSRLQRKGIQAGQAGRHRAAIQYLGDASSALQIANLPEPLFHDPDTISRRDRILPEDVSRFVEFLADLPTAGIDPVLYNATRKIMHKLGISGGSANMDKLLHVHCAAGTLPKNVWFVYNRHSRGIERLSLQGRAQVKGRLEIEMKTVPDLWIDDRHQHIALAAEDRDRAGGIGPYVLKHGEVAKFIGWIDDALQENESALSSLAPHERDRMIAHKLATQRPYVNATTGTSRPNTLCFTDNMETCIAVGFAAKRHNATGAVQESKIRIFHVLELESGAAVRQMTDYIRSCQHDGFTVTAYRHGGTDIESDVHTMDDILRETEVELLLDETCDKRPSKNLAFGMIINNDNSVSVYTDIRGED